MVCHASNVFLVLKVPWSITDAFSISMARLLNQAWLAILEPLAAISVFLKCSFFRVLKALPVSPIQHQEQFVQGNYIRRWSAIPSKVGISELGTVVVEC